MQDILTMIPNVVEGRKYWFFRTEGGDLYDSFSGGGYIAIGFNEISLDELGDKKSLTSKKFDRLAEKIKKAYPNKQHRNSLNQLLYFKHDMKVNDVVLIPSKNSQTIRFGIIESEPYTEPDEKIKEEEQKCDYNKRRSVRWVKHIDRDALHPKLYQLMFSHFIITDANPYAILIDNTLNSFYIKNNQANMVLNVKTNKTIGANDFFSMGNAVLDIVRDFNKYYDTNYSVDDIVITLSLDSPGKINFKGPIDVMKIIGVCLAIVAINGGGIKFEAGDYKIDLNTDGFVKQVIEYQDHSQERQAKNAILDSYMKEFEIESPTELMSILNTFKQNEETILVEQVKVMPKEEQLQLEQKDTTNKGNKN